MTLTKLKHLKKKDIERIGNIVADAFLAEPGPYPNFYNVDQAHCFFQETIRMLYKSHCLYALEDEAGFVAWFHKNHGIRWYHKLDYTIRLLQRVSLERMNAFIENGKEWDGYEKHYKNEKDFIDVFLVAVKKSEQGKGHFRELLIEPMEEAKRYKIPCILDTDSRKKKEKYEHIGFHTVKEMKLLDGTEMFILEYHE